MITPLASPDWITRLERHPGTAAWLQAAGTVTALSTAVIGGWLALRRYRRDGVVPKSRAVRDRDGRRAVVTVWNAGRSTGTLVAMFVERDGDEYNPQPRVRPKDPTLRFPADLRPAHQIPLLLDADNPVFNLERVRIIVQHGTGELSPRIRRMRRGEHINVSRYADPLPARSASDGHPAAGALGRPGDRPVTRPDPEVWENAGRELGRLAELHRSGRLSRLDLMFGRYRALRRAQRDQARD